MRRYSHATIFCSLIAILSLVLAGSQVSAAPLSAGPVGTAFTYQGQLKDGGGNPITNTCDFQFSLYDDVASGSQIGSTQTMTSVTVTNGYFTSSLDFGPGAFDGSARWLQIAVRCPSGSGGFTTLAPRQLLTPTPYSLYALNADYQNIVVVAKNGNSSGPSYDTITAALNSITTAGPTNRFLIYVAPGIYTETVTMKQYVDIEGAGELATKITSTGSGSYTTGTLIGANNAELRFLTVENTGGATFAVALYNSGASPRLTHITANASGGTTSDGVYNNLSSAPAMTNVTATASGAGSSTNYGVYNNSSSPAMVNVTAAASGGTYTYGVFNTSSSSPTMTNVTASASGAATSNTGVYNGSSSATIQSSAISASGGNSYGIYNYAASGFYTVKVSNSRILAAGETISNDAHFSTQVGASQLGAGGSAAANGGLLTCAFTYNDDFAGLGVNCQNP